jgi:hypothetical protein
MGEGKDKGGGELRILDFGFRILIADRGFRIADFDFGLRILDFGFSRNFSFNYKREVYWLGGGEGVAMKGDGVAEGGGSVG